MPGLTEDDTGRAGTRWPAGFRPVRGSAAGPIAVSPGADDRRAVGLATGARKQRAGPGPQVRGRLGGVGQFEREHVPGEPLTPGERQAMGRCAAG